MAYKIRFREDDKRVMKIVLGTVAFGLDGYSLPNTGKPKPSFNEMHTVLEYAYKHGVEYLDTANAYGDAEESISSYCTKFRIISKLKPNCLEEIADNQILPTIKAELRTDLKRLGVTHIWGYYFHTPKYVYNKKAVAALAECKKEGLVENIGVSIYEPQDACYAARQGLDIIQVPYNVLDQRLHKTDFFNIAKANRVTVFARQPFLKGLLAMPVEKIPPHLEFAKHYVAQIDKIVSAYNCQRIKACLLFSLMNPNVNYVVLGVDNLSQLQFNLDVDSNMAGAIQGWNTVANFGQCYEELRATFQDIPDYIVMPSLWESSK